MAESSVLIRCRSCRTLNRVPSGKLESHPVCGQCKQPLEVPRSPLNVTAAAFDREVNDWPEYVLVEFWAKWCGYCRMVEPVVNDLAAGRAGQLKVLKADVDAEPALARRFTVKATPTFLFYRNGKLLGRLDGAPKEKIELVMWIDRFMQA
jgi:thioredoxin 2